MRRLLYSSILIISFLLAFSACHNPMMKKLMHHDGNGGQNAIKSVHITDVHAPAKGETPNSSATSTTADVSVGAVSWDPADDPFGPLTVYTATLTITAENGKTFASGLSTTINTHAATVSVTDDTTAVVSYAFPATLAKAVTSITVKNQPTNLSYNHGDPLDLSGLEVTLTYEDASTEDVAYSNFGDYGISTDPIHGNEVLYATHNGKKVTVTLGSKSAETDTLVVSKPTLTVTFDYNYSGGGSTSQSVLYDDPVSDPTAPTRTGYVFGGWYTETACTNAYNFSAPVHSSFTLYAEWEIPRDGLTIDTAWKVYDVATLQRVGKDAANGWTLTAYYIQTANIDMSGEAFTRIGFNTPTAQQFSGNYNGGGYTISNLTINATADYQSLFGYIGSGGTVKNVGLEEVNVTGRQYTGGIAGYNSGRIENCYVTGSITSTDTYIGGITGRNYGIVQNCYSTVDINVNVTGQEYSGSLVGYNGGLGTVRNCYATGFVNGYSNIAGVVGSSDNTQYAQNCVALNPRVTTRWSSVISSPSIARVMYGGSLTMNGYNYARATMELFYAWDITTGTGTAWGSYSIGNVLRDGASISASDYHTETWWTAAGRWRTDFGASVWDFDTVWEWNSTTNLPILRGFAPGTQNHEVKSP